MPKMEPFEIDSITCTRVLGEGATGKVYLGATADGNYCAIKILEDTHRNYFKLH